MDLWKGSDVSRKAFSVQWTKQNITLCQWFPYTILLYALVWATHNTKAYPRYEICLCNFLLKKSKFSWKLVVCLCGCVCLSLFQRLLVHIFYKCESVSLIKILTRNLSKLSLHNNVKRLVSLTVTFIVYLNKVSVCVFVSLIPIKGMDVFHHGNRK